MTVATTTNAVERAGNGTATEFSFSPIRIFNATQLEVVVRDSLGNLTTIPRGTGSAAYAVVATFVENESATGAIRYPESGGSPLPTGSFISIRRVIPALQEVSIENQGGYLPEVQERLHDEHVMRVQQLEEELDRTVKVPFGSDTLPDDFINLASSSATAAAASAAAAAISADEAEAAASLVTGAVPILNNLQAFTSSGSYTPATGVTRVFVEVWGGGGGGGGVVANNRVSSSGGGGGYTCGFVDVTASVPITVTVGAGGTGGANTGANGTDGGTSSFGSLSATGGAGGTGSGAGASDAIFFAGGIGGAGSGGTVNLTGERGGHSYFNYVPPNSTAFPASWRLDLKGGAAPRGGVGGAVTDATGNTSATGVTPGGGGTGARSQNGGGGATAGGNGANGLVLVWRP
jgi:hypothetical protein